MSPVPVISIDGPGASGKTVVGVRLAKRLGYRFIDTGAMYRAVTWLALEKGVSLQDHEALGDLASSTSIEVSNGNGPPEIYADGRDLSKEIRSREVDQAVSRVSMAPSVREALVRLQRGLAAKRSVVMAGRDIGTVVLPDADLKVFLLASAEERARRRYKELAGHGAPVEYVNVLADLKRRDKLDSERVLSPLAPAGDAKQLGTDNITVDEVVEEIWQLTEKR